MMCNKCRIRMRKQSVTEDTNIWVCPKCGNTKEEVINVAESTAEED